MAHRRIFTESSLRAMLGVPRRGMRLELPRGSRFSPAAEDFLREWRIELAYTSGSFAGDGLAAGEEDAAVSRTLAGDRPNGPQLTGNRPNGPQPTGNRADGPQPTGDRPNGPQPTGDRPNGPQPTGNRPRWDRPATFPVQTGGDAPRCVLCNSPVTQKSERLTQVDADTFAPKNTPRVRFRGKMDTLHAMVLLTASRARILGAPRAAEQLKTIAAYCREITSAEYNGRSPASIQVAGFDEREIRRATHDPVGVLGVDHVIPGIETVPGADSEVLHRLNLVRAETREAELAALDAFAPTADHPVVAPELLRSVNRLSSAVYLVELLFYRDEGESVREMP